MHKKAIFLSVVIMIGLLTVSCGDGDNPSPKIDTPDSYSFSRNGQSTVSFGGQTERIAMAEEVLDAFAVATFTEAEIDAMFDHQTGNDDFSDPALNSSTKSVRSKVAASVDYFASNSTDATSIKADFDSWIAGQVDEVFPHWETEASAGIAGYIQQAGGGRIRYVSADGLEYNQAFAKSLIGGLMIDQSLNNYLSTAVLDEGTNLDDNDGEVLVDSEAYTNMEHKWDEAFGYLYGASADPANPNNDIGDADSFLNNYIGTVNESEEFSGIAEDIFDAFLLGRAAIVAGNYSVRDQQVAIIREKVSFIPAVRAVHYLQSGKTGLEADTPDMASIFHALSEAYGFIYSLQFTHNPDTDEPYFTKAEVESFLDTIFPTGTNQNGFWDVTTADLQSVSDEIAAEFGFTVEQAL